MVLCKIHSSQVSVLIGNKITGVGEGGSSVCVEEIAHRNKEIQNKNKINKHDDLEKYQN